MLWGKNNVLLLLLWPFIETRTGTDRSSLHFDAPFVRARLSKN